MRFHTNEGAQLFHICDQLSQWSPYAHRQYRRALTLDADDLALLAKHVAVREHTHGWGGLEQVFYTEASDPIAEALKRGQLTASDAKIEREMLARLAPKVNPIIVAGRPALAAFARLLEARKGELARFAETASRFTGGGEVKIDTHLIASVPHSGGGGANGGVLTVEVAEDVPGFGLLVHESWHAFVHPHDVEITAQANAVGAQFEDLSEAMAHAISPGLFRWDAERDELQSAAHDLKNGGAWDKLPAQ